jgi:hypothetical protein
MKKSILLLAILAFAVCALSQIKERTINQLHPRSNSSQDVNRMSGNKEWKKYEINHLNDSGQAIQHPALNPYALVQLFDSIYNWEWDAISLEWNIASRCIDIIYDANYNETSRLWQEMTGSTWVNSTLITNTYDLNNNQTSHLSQSWSGSEWLNEIKFTYTYDANNNQISNKEEIWTGSYWFNYSQSLYTYDANSNQISGLMQVWNNSTWENHSLYTYTYDANNHPIVYLFQYWNGIDWDNFSQSTYTYDENYNLTSVLRKTWNGSAWEDSWESTYTYDANSNLINELRQNWNGTTWENYWLDTYTYDENNNVLNYSWENWNGSSWVHCLQINYTYDSDNLMQSNVLIWWNDTGSAIEEMDSTYYYFHTVLGVEERENKLECFSIFPNPNNGKFTIIGNNPVISVEIYNSLGELIFFENNLSGEASMENGPTKTKPQINISTLPRGVYFVRVLDETTVELGKLIKE